jgi:hypothetical protein
MARDPALLALTIDKSSNHRAKSGIDRKKTVRGLFCREHRVEQAFIPKPE